MHDTQAVSGISFWCRELHLCDISLTADCDVSVHVDSVDARSQITLATYKDLARDLATEGLHPLAAINCFDWTDVCQIANVPAFPIIRIYRPNAEFLPYSGYLSKAALYAAVKLYVCCFHI